MNTAVLLVIFRRPDLTAKVMEVLRRVKPPRLYVAADASRPGRDEDHLCQAARACVGMVDWPCELFTDYAVSNLGSARRVTSAMAWLFRNETEGIILEDDCLPEDTFFPYCEELLARYRDDERVMNISGYHGPAANSGEKPSYWFTKQILTWGWATWARAWRHHNLDLAALPEWTAYKDSAEFRQNCPNQEERDFWIWKHEASLHIYDAWDYQWVMTCRMRNGLGIVPSHNLIRNIGFRADAEHTTDDLLGVHRTALRPMEWPLRHPASMAIDEAFDRRTWETFHRPLSFLQRVHRKLLQLKEFLFQVLGRSAKPEPQTTVVPRKQEAPWLPSRRAPAPKRL